MESEQEVLVPVDQGPEEKPQRLTGRAPETEIKHAAALLLADSGMSYGAIAKALNRHTQTIKTVVPKMRRVSLAHPEKLKLASKCVEKVMGGFVGEKDKEGKIVQDPRVKASDALRAAELSYKAAGELDRADEGGGSGPTFTQITINQTYFRD